MMGNLMHVRADAVYFLNIISVEMGKSSFHHTYFIALTRLLLVCSDQFLRYFAGLHPLYKTA